MTTNFKSRLTRQPFNLFLLTAMLLFVFSFFTWGHSLDFHLQDTYFVVATIYFVWLLAFIFLFIWTIYLPISRTLWTKFLTWSHIIATLIPLILLLASGLWYKPAMLTSGKEYFTYQTLQEQQRKQLIVFLPIIVIFMLGQVAFVISLLVGLIKELTGKTTTAQH